MTAMAAPLTPAAPQGSESSPPASWTPPIPPKKPKTTLIIGSIVILLVIVAAAYFVGMPMLKANQKSSEGFVPSPTATYTITQTVLPAPEYTIALPETTALPATVRDDRLEEDYEQIYTLNQKFAFGQKVNFAHDLTRPPLYIRFNLTIPLSAVDFQLSADS